MPSDTASTSSRLTIPISPTFSTDTISSAPPSEATSDEQPDLGAFTTVLWAWNNLQPPPRAPIPQFHSPPPSRTSRLDSSSISSFTHPGLSEASGTESPVPLPDTVWAQHQLQSYFNSVTPSSERVQELEEDEYDIRGDNDNARYRESPPPPSPLSDGSRTVEIYEAASDIDIPDTDSYQQSLYRSAAGADMAVPVTVFSPNQDPSAVLHGSDEGDNSSLTSREPPIQLADGYHPTYSSNRSLPHQIPALRNSSNPPSEVFQVQITPRRSEFPIHDLSSLHSHSTSRAVGTSRPPWLPPTLVQIQQSSHVVLQDSPQNVPIDDSSSIYSYHTRDDSESAVRSLLNQARARSLVDDNTSFVHSTVSNSDTHSPATSDLNPTHNPSLLQTPESSNRSLTSNSQSSASPQWMPSASPQRPSATHCGLGSSNNDQREPDQGRRLKVSTFSPQVEVQSPLPTPTEVFPYSPTQPSLVASGGEDEDDSHTPTRNHARSQARRDQNSAASRYFREAVSHPYPHLLKGHHLLPTTMESSTEWEQPALTMAHHAPSSATQGQLSGTSEWEFDQEQPSLGLLDEALGFIAAERAKWEAGRESGSHPLDATFTSPEWQHVVETTKRKKRKKKSPVKATKEDLSSSPSLSVTRPLLLAADSNNDIQDFDDGQPITSAAMPMPTHMTNDKLLTSRTSTKTVDIDLDKRITILSRLKPAAVEDSAANMIEGEPLILTGKKGNRVGRKERERVKTRRDKERIEWLHQSQPKGMNSVLAGGDGEGDWDADDDDLEEDGGVDGGIGFSSSSAAENVGGSRASAGSRAYIHHPPGKGAYKSTPASPRNVSPTRSAREDGIVAKRNDSEHEQGTTNTPTKTGRGRKKPRIKRPRLLLHSKSYPNLHLEATLDSGNALKSRKVSLNVSFDLEEDDVMEGSITLDQRKRSRLIALARKLQTHFREQRRDLVKVIHRLENIGRKEWNVLPSWSEKVSSPRIRRRGSIRNSHRGPQGSLPAVLVSTPSHEESGVEEQEQDPAELLIQGRSVRHGEPLIHIFVDHSNILIGLLNFLKRSPPPQRIISEYLDGNPRSAFIPESANLSKKSLVIPIIESPMETRGEHPIPLPSFATAKAMKPNASEEMVLSRSLPAESVLEAHMARRRAAQKQGGVSDGNEDQAANASGTVLDKKLKFPKHLWHAGLALILERGRPISRRVVVTSSPLYQPMEKIQNIGYEVRVYIRVPDLGNGMDRERHKDKEAKNAITRPSQVGRNPPQTPIMAKKTHIRHLSGSTSAESGSAGSGRPGSLNSTSNVTTPGASSGNTGLVPSRIRYREQGVDELLQLKLHQAIADADSVPKGSTIVLATGDGNVGQFNEDGFLGPVRTALKRGWKVELYAWEDGLSRSWRREFGENSEWGRKGSFQIIPLEQFATSLVEAAGW